MAKRLTSFRLSRFESPVKENPMTKRESNVDTTVTAFDALRMHLRGRKATQAVDLCCELGMLRLIMITSIGTLHRRVQPL